MFPAAIKEEERLVRLDNFMTWDWAVHVALMINGCQHHIIRDATEITAEIEQRHSARPAANGTASTGPDSTDEAEELRAAESKALRQLALERRLTHMTLYSSCSHLIQLLIPDELSLKSRTSEARPRELYVHLCDTYGPITSTRAHEDGLWSKVWRTRIGDAENPMDKLGLINVTIRELVEIAKARKMTIDQFADTLAIASSVVRSTLY